ncbi:MAG TPA: hypothetical protein VMS76_00300 [Planctomycetota bacterium]|nr:hypothetical protein [Planctomycetota bacterium]
MSPKSIAIALTSLLAAPLALELGYRAWTRAGGYRYSASSARNEIALVLSPLRNARVVRLPRDEEAELTVQFLHPYLGVEYKSGPRWTISAELFSKRSEAEYTVLILGGSVSGLFASGRGAQHLRELLRADPLFAGRTVRCINQGRGGFKQPQQLMLLSYLFARGFLPDMVLEIDGFNEVALSNDNRARGLHPLYPSFIPWARLGSSGAASPELLDAQLATWREWRGAERLAVSAAESPWLHSALLGRWTLWRLRRMRARWAEAQLSYMDLFDSEVGDEPWRGPPFDESLDGALGQVAWAWKESSLAMRAQCAERGIDYVHVLQPTLHDQGSKPVTEEELRTGGVLESWSEGVRSGYPLLRKVGEELREEGVDFLDLSRAFSGVEESLYYDGCHFGDRGNEILAERIAEGVLAALEREAAGRTGDGR